MFREQYVRGLYLSPTMTLVFTEYDVFKEKPLAGHCPTLPAHQLDRTGMKSAQRGGRARFLSLGGLQQVHAWREGSNEMQTKDPEGHLEGKTWLSRWKEGVPSVTIGGSSPAMGVPGCLQCVCLSFSFLVVTHQTARETTMNSVCWGLIPILNVNSSQLTSLLIRP